MDQRRTSQRRATAPSNTTYRTNRSTARHQAGGARRSTGNSPQPQRRGASQKHAAAASRTPSGARRQGETRTSYGYAGQQSHRHHVQSREQSVSMPARPRYGAGAAKILAIVIIVALVGWGLFTLLLSLSRGSEEAAAESAPRVDESVDDNGVVHGVTPDDISYLAYGRDVATANPNRISFAAVGDIIGSEWALDIADANAGKKGDNTYDFTPFFSDVSSFLNQYDLRFVNEECVVDPLKPVEAYPSFNSSESLIDALAGAPFNIVNFNSNHSWDHGKEGIEQTRKVLAAYPEIMTVGTFESKSDREVVRVVERNGAKIAFLSYSYGYNSYDNAKDLPDKYNAVPFDQSVMKADIARAKGVADAVVVYVHWGTEYQMDVDEQQREYAQFLADEGVDLVIGSHAHIMQPIQYVTGKGGNKVPVVFGLSDFVSGWTLTKSIISGVFTCDFVWNGDKLQVDDPRFYPAIEWQGTEGGKVSVRLLKDMSSADIAKNRRTEDVEDDLSYLRTYFNDLAMEVPVEWNDLTAPQASASASTAASSAASPAASAKAEVNTQASAPAAER